jgi:hypothetical protein
MIVLDEQLLSYGVREPIARWYHGAVLAITQLRPQTVVRDDAIPVLLRAAKHPTFVTINITDFWRKMPSDPRFCIACIAVSHTHALEVPDLLRRLFRLVPFRTQRQRLGTIIQVSTRQVQYYTKEIAVIHRIVWPRAT